MTLNKNLFETALRHLLVESAEYSVQMFEGSGTQWRKTRQVLVRNPAFNPYGCHSMRCCIAA